MWFQRTRAFIGISFKIRWGDFILDMRYRAFYSSICSYRRSYDKIGFGIAHGEMTAYMVEYREVLAVELGSDES